MSTAVLLDEPPATEIEITPEMLGRALARYRELRDVGVSEDYLLEEVLRAALVARKAV